jgi:hypothetical protein
MQPRLCPIQCSPSCSDAKKSVEIPSRAASGVAAESQDEFEGGRPPRRAGKQEIPCYDPATGTYLGTLPAMTPDEVGAAGEMTTTMHTVTRCALQDADHCRASRCEGGSAQLALPLR